MDEDLEIIADSGGTRRVVIYRRPSGALGYREEKYYKNELAGEERWVVIWRGASFYEDLEAAKKELPSEISWLHGKSTEDE